MFYAILATVLALICGIVPQTAGAEPAQQFTPASADVALEKYPLVGKNTPMGVSETKRLGLRLEVLQVPLAAWNHYREVRGGRGAWVFETLPSGTVVAVDGVGRPWYKADCSNRLYVPAQCLACPPLAGSKGAVPGTTPPAIGKGGAMEAGGSLAGRLPGLGTFFQVLTWIAIGMLVTAVLIGFGMWLARMLRDMWRANFVPLQAAQPAAGIRPVAAGGAPVGVIPAVVPAVTAVGRHQTEDDVPAHTAVAPVGVPNEPATAGHGRHATAADCVVSLAAQGFRDITGIERHQDGTVRFNATVRS